MKIKIDRKLIIAILSLTISGFGDWPEALLPPGVRTQNAPPGGMTFPVLLAEVYLPTPAAFESGDLANVALAFSSDGRLLAIGTGDGLQLLDIYRNHRLWQTKLPGTIAAVAFTKSGGLVVVADEPTGGAEEAPPQAVSLLSVANGERVWRQTLTATATSWQVHPLGDTMALAFAAGTVGGPFPGIGLVVDGQNQRLGEPLEFAGVLLAAATRGSEGVLLASDAEATDDGQFGNRIARFTPLDTKLAIVHAFKSPAPPAERRAHAAGIGLSENARFLAVARSGTEPFLLDLAADDQTPYLVRTGGGVFGQAAIQAPTSAIFLGAIPERGASVAPGAPTDLVVVDATTRKKWHLPGTFVPGRSAVSADGRWIALLAEDLPSRRPRGRGLVLLDAAMPGKGEQRVAYTYSTESIPPGPLAMAADGSAIAFVEFRRHDKKSAGPAQVVNVIR